MSCGCPKPRRRGERLAAGESSRALTESCRARDLRTDADAAWRQGDFGRVVNAYEALKNLESLDLSRSEIARLRYAKPRAERLSDDPVARILPEFRPNGTSSYERVEKLEEQLAVELTDDYRCFCAPTVGKVLLDRSRT